MDLILKTNGICRKFKGQMAVNKVSLNIPRNSVYGLLGPNGAGKSTTLKMLTGILKPTFGTVTFNGQPWSREALNEIGALIEMPPLYENLTARENLKVRTTLLGLPDEKQSLSHFKGRSLCWKASRRYFPRRRKHSAKKKLSVVFMRCSANMETDFPNHSQHCCPGLLMV